MNTDDIRELKARKNVLRQEMQQIQSEIKTSLSDVRSSVSSHANISFWVEKYPLRVAGTALIGGFLLARRIGRGKKLRVTKAGAGSMFAALLLDEFKRLATRRAVDFIVLRVEEAMENRKDL